MAQYKLTIDKNGTQITTDDAGHPLLLRTGDNLADILEDFGFSATGFQKIMVNGNFVEEDELDEVVIDKDITVKYINKSQGGFVSKLVA